MEFMTICTTRRNPSWERGRKDKLIFFTNCKKVLKVERLEWSLQFLQRKEILVLPTMYLARFWGEMKEAWDSGDLKRKYLLQAASL